MSNFITAKDQIIKLISETVPEIQDNYGTSFDYQDFSIDSPEEIQSRCFNYGLSGMAIAPNNCGRKNRFGVTMSINIFYREETDRDEMFNAIMSDYELISERLLEVSNWDRPQSGMVILSAGEESIFLADIDEDVEYGAILTLQYPLIYHKS